MSHVRAVTLALVVASAAVPAASTPALAAAARCTAVSPGSSPCSYQSGGGPGEFVCAATRCELRINGGVYVIQAGFGATVPIWTSFGDVIGVFAFGAGAATAGDN